MKKKNIAIFASGSGSNARKILEHFEGREDIKVALIVTNKNKAGVINHANDFDIPTLKLDRVTFYESQDVLNLLQSKEIDLIVLAGFLWLIPAYLIHAYPNKIINIHPALLPKYGGKGMYGHHVHQAVKDNNESESGMTIHFVNEKFDEGNHIFQAKCKLESTDTADDIASKVLNLEHKYFAKVIDSLLTNS